MCIRNVYYWNDNYVYQISDRNWKYKQHPECQVSSCWHRRLPRLDGGFPMWEPSGGFGLSTSSSLSAKSIIQKLCRVLGTQTLATVFALSFLLLSDVWNVLQMLPMSVFWRAVSLHSPAGTKNKTQQIQSNFQGFDSHWRRRRFLEFNSCCWKQSWGGALSLHIERKSCSNQLLRSCWGHWAHARLTISLQTSVMSHTSTSKYKCFCTDLILSVWVKYWLQCCCVVRWRDNANSEKKDWKKKSLILLAQSSSRSGQRILSLLVWNTNMTTCPAHIFSTNLDISAGRPHVLRGHRFSGSGSAPWRGKNIKDHFMSHLAPKESKQPRTVSRALRELPTIRSHLYENEKSKYTFNEIQIFMKQYRCHHAVSAQS